jgi:hypothetical protein
MKKYIYASILSALAGAFMSCEKAIDIDVPYEEPKLVMNGYLNPDSSFSMQLSRSKFILDRAELKNVEDARLSLFEGERKLGQLKHVQEGFYELAGIKPEPGKTYRIKAERAGFKSVQATEKSSSFVVPAAVKAAREELQDDYQYDNSYRINFKIPDPEEETNFYMLRAFEKRTGHWYDQNGELTEDYTYWNVLQIESPDPGLEEVCVNNCDMLLSDIYFNGKTYEVQLTGTSYSWGSEEEIEVYISLFNISEAAYLYYKTVDQSQQAEGDPFAEPVRVYSNVEGGYGVWAAVSGKMVKADF